MKLIFKDPRYFRKYEFELLHFDGDAEDAIQKRINLWLTMFRIRNNRDISDLMEKPVIPYALKEAV